MSICVNTLKNTGISKCQINIQAIKKAILLPPDATEFTGETAAEFTTWLKAGIQSENIINRFLVLPGFNGLTDNTDDPVEDTDGYGHKRKIKDSEVSFSCTYDSNICLSKKLRALNNQKMLVIFIDEKDNAFGVQTETGFTGFQCECWFSQSKLPTDGKVQRPVAYIGLLDVTEYQDEIDFISMDWKQSAINGLIDVVLTGTGAALAGSVTITDECSGIDITSTYSTLLAKKEAWKVDGTTPAADPTYASGKFTFALTSGAHTIDLVDPAALLALAVPVMGIESTGSVSVTATAA